MQIPYEKMVGFAFTSPWGRVALSNAECLFSFKAGWGRIGVCVGGEDCLSPLMVAAAVHLSETLPVSCGTAVPLLPDTAGVVCVCTVIITCPFCIGCTALRLLPVTSGGAVRLSGHCLVTAWWRDCVVIAFCLLATRQSLCLSSQCRCHYLSLYPKKNLSGLS